MLRIAPLIRLIIDQKLTALGIIGGTGLGLMVARLDWLKFAFAVLAGSIGLIFVAFTARENETTLEHTIKCELEDLRQHLFER